MRNSLSQRAWKKGIPVIRLDTVWYVDADKSYEVDRANHAGDHIVAIRTLTGCGKVIMRDGREFLLTADSVALFRQGMIPPLWYGGGALAFLLV
ncbi:MAG: hypothetical protein E7324_05525 [Clostridiales bacterium]|nr:hypothetical protein [Clostridiales bacterium]